MWIVALLACSPEPQPVPVVSDPPPIEYGIVAGRVTALDGTGVANIVVSIDGARDTTNDLGQFELEAPVDTDLVLRTQSASWTQNSIRVRTQVDQPPFVELSVLLLEHSRLAAAEKGGTIATPSGVKIELPPAAFGDQITGAVDVHVALIDTFDEMVAAPGGMAFEDGLLESFGMVEVVTTQGGVPLELELPAELSFPVTDGAAAAGLWHFDAQSGLWEPEGSVQIVDGRAVARVEHFSWWNVDEPLSDKSCVSGRLVDVDGSPVGNLHVSTLGLDYLGGSKGTQTDDDGRFCADVKRGSTNRVSAYRKTEDGFEEWIGTATVGSVPTACELGSCTDLGDLAANYVETGCLTGEHVGHDWLVMDLRDPVARQNRDVTPHRVVTIPAWEGESKWCVETPRTDGYAIFPRQERRSWPEETRPGRCGQTCGVVTMPDCSEKPAGLLKFNLNDPDRWSLCHGGMAGSAATAKQGLERIQLDLSYSTSRCEVTLEGDVRRWLRRHGARVLTRTDSDDPSGGCRAELSGTTARGNPFHLYVHAQSCPLSSGESRTAGAIYATFNGRPPQPEPQWGCVEPAQVGEPEEVHGELEAIGYVDGTGVVILQPVAPAPVPAPKAMPKP